MRFTALSVLAAIAGFTGQVKAFAPAASFTRVAQNVASTGSSFTTSSYGASSTNLNMMDDPSAFVETTSQIVNNVGTNPLLSFADQGQNLAGIFFQASLLPYLIFLYFLQFRGNRTPDLGNFGFQFVLPFVAATIPSGIISKSTYGVSLADVDWLHGGAEALLTTANIFIFLGFKEAMSNPDQPKVGKPYLIGGGIAAAFAAACALGPGLGFEAHSPFLFGLGNLSPETTMSLPWVTHPEPANALSIPTWLIHFSSVFEFLFAMQIVWQFSEATKNDKWKGLTWGMLPLHASGVCACTYHFFYNPSVLQFLVSMQAGFTCLGNITCAIAAYRIARSNGWELGELNPLPKSEPSPSALAADAAAAMPLELTAAKESNVATAGKLVALTVVSSYLLKYGELGLDIPFEANGIIALAMVLGIPGITAAAYINQSKQEGGELAISLPSFGSGEDGEGLSMADVKKFGVAGTVAYVLTELAFWAVAFPVASYALYNTSGHWPDVINDSSDRATVLGFIFAGANVARLLVPLRLGAALALAPWVDENILSRGEDTGSAATDTQDL
mmetsp:Transcript_7749/g.11099  ORF Transcript_7749/g.11099 Transcript_7749/m.11099 type:complete len:559 (-) Transcript_7749:44-1720(-)